ncbi:MAG: tetratricopeptide repeat protein [Aureispira sp.]|nr:tetratricopeptide repeat protein [Aureispira sp.]
MKYICIVFLGLLSLQLMAQSEHEQLITANEIYEKKDYETASKSYLNILNENVNSLKGNYNLGNTLYKRKKYKEAIPYFQRAAGETEDREVRSKVYHNLGNTFFKEKNYKEAAKSYMQALRDNPKDFGTKNNLALTQKIIKQQQQQQKEQEQEKEKEEQQKQQKQQKQQEEQDGEGDDRQQSQDDTQSEKEEEEKDDPNSGDKDKDEEPIDNEPKGESSGKGEELSKDDVERLMQIIENEDKKVQEKLMKRARGKHKKPEKDW